MSHYFPLELPVGKQGSETSLYTKQYMEVPYVKACLPTCGDLGIPVYDDSISISGAYSHGNNESGFDGNNFIINYSSSNNYFSDSSMNVDCDDMLSMGQTCVRYGRIIHSPNLQLDGLRYDSQDRKVDPYSPVCMVPLPGHLLEPNCIRRRNERERERVRCVNEGYDRLKEHLPLENKDRRISKVETLRSAIEYIRDLQSLLDEADGKPQSPPEGPCDCQYINKRRKRKHSLTSEEPQTPESDY